MANGGVALTSLAVDGAGGGYGVVGDVEGAAVVAATVTAPVELGGRDKNPLEGRRAISLSLLGMLASSIVECKWSAKVLNLSSLTGRTISKRIDLDSTLLNNDIITAKHRVIRIRHGIRRSLLRTCKAIDGRWGRRAQRDRRRIAES